MKLESNKRYEAEKTRIENLFEEGGDENQKALVAQLIQQAAFMAVTLQDLQEEIASEGATDQYQNGSQQWGRKVSATLQSFCAVQKNYVTVIKTLSAILPPRKKGTIKPDPPRVKTLEEMQREAEEAKENEKRDELRRRAIMKIAAEYQRQQREAYARGESFYQLYSAFEEQHLAEYMEEIRAQLESEK